MPERILLIDDNKMGLSVRKVVLEELGYDVTAVCCSLEAFDKYCAQMFDLVVTDYRMPQMDGIKLIGRIRERTPEIPIVLLSGVAEALGLSEHNTGADIVIQKNAHEIPTLTRAVTRLLSRRVPKKPVRAQRIARSRSAAVGGVRAQDVR
jgi:CheY-like chemotaxis protein